MPDTELLEHGHGIEQAPVFANLALLDPKYIDPHGPEQFARRGMSHKHRGVTRARGCPNDDAVAIRQEIVDRDMKVAKPCQVHRNHASYGSTARWKALDMMRIV
jgi:hypothetical protein